LNKGPLKITTTVPLRDGEEVEDTREEGKKGKKGCSKKREGKSKEEKDKVERMTLRQVLDIYEFR